MAVTINEGLARSIRSAFRHVTPNSLNYLSTTWFKNDVFRRFISCDITGPNVEVPLMLRPWVEDHIHKSRYSNWSNSKMVLPIRQQEVIFEKRTADSIIKRFFEILPQNGVICIKTNKGLTYYGGHGCIFDSQYRPLLLFCLYGNYIVDPTTGFIDGFIYTECRIYVHPNVIIDESDLMNKAIIKKIIPYLLRASSNEFVYSGRVDINVSPNIKTKVVIEDKSDLFSTPSQMPATFNNSDMNTFLNDRIEDVVRQLKV